MPAAPNSNPLRHRTLPARTWPTNAATAVTPTTNSDAAMASLASIPAT